ncbi:MAG: hypothetical protein EPN46_07810 [Candidimonas sp.]|nr:MAG: hypothetical protein EPN77_11725 [Candidimonas sp.]TAM24144.1 MAG: hypothetical protein EPN62_07885 [Candidimonas sp.]TAM76874.1 MAG: hypothetical protein EPN46_07810 [Candidimonas sp.]
MKNALLAAVLMAVALPAGAQVGVSINLGEPGFYGQINIGNAPPPQLIYRQPVVIVPAPQYAVPPIYLRVPPGQAEHWRHYCARYNACGRPVYFVRDDWYLNRYAPYYRERHGRHHEYREHDDHRGDGDHRDHDRGHGHGHGH